MIELVGLLFSALILWLFLRRRTPKIDDLGISGTLVWLDKGTKTKPFFNEEFYVCGKLDLIYRQATAFLGSASSFL